MFVGFYETFYPSDSYYFIEETQESNGIYLFLADTGEKEGRVYERFFIYADDGSYRVHYFGAIKEEYRGESFQMGFRNGGKHTDSAGKKKQKSFWEKRAERHKLYMDLALSQAATELAQNYVFFKIPSALTNPKPKTGK